MTILGVPLVLKPLRRFPSGAVGGFASELLPSPRVMERSALSSLDVGVDRGSVHAVLAGQGGLGLSASCPLADLSGLIIREGSGPAVPVGTSLGTEPAR